MQCKKTHPSPKSSPVNSWQSKTCGTGSARTKS